MKSICTIARLLRYRPTAAWWRACEVTANSGEQFYAYGDPFPGIPTGPLPVTQVDISKDGRFIAARSKSYGNPVFYDSRARRVVKLAEGLRRLRSGGNPTSFTFVDSGRLMVWAYKASLNSHLLATLVDVPSGRVLSNPEMPKVSRVPLPELSHLSDSHFVLIHPCGEFASCAYNYTTSDQTITSQEPALDVLGQYYIAESGRGEVALYERGKGVQATVKLR